MFSYKQHPWFGFEVKVKFYTLLEFKRYNLWIFIAAFIQEFILIGKFSPLQFYKGESFSLLKNLT